MRKSRACNALAALIILPVTLVTAAALLVRLRPRRVMRWVRRFNRHVFNRLTLPWAGRPGSPFVLVEHAGRRTGRLYQTPVVAASMGNSLYIALTYGSETDWCRNVRAAGQGTIRGNGTAFTAGSPEVMGQSVALPAFPLPVRLACRLIGIREFLQLTRVREDSRSAI
jgi:deazaflavin-dependent oxidoreductase (nitroreductase family)